MKLKHILPILTLGTLAFQSCDDNKMEWYDPHDGNGTSSSELPLLLAEQIKLYNPIKSYIPNENFVIGAGIGMDQYLSKENVAAYVNENFNSVTLGNAMKMSSIINSKGEADYSKVDAFLQVLPQDIAVYGIT
ncbi:endo-1,4-beta-xylanase [Bacteroides rodentium]|uniref:endo-1,4-beta-xylanase n=1 Tax=Bacteroides rodentium TaxID=691816 RepID=UPI000AB6C3D6|nr:endo-1,4-beta-xylanase [Bacteroides rodentium]